MEVLRIYDFFSYPNIKQKQQSDLLWPCFQYEVRAKTIITKLNIFEYYVLRMFPLKKGNIDEISDALCLDKNLVNFIVSGLKTKYLVEGSYLTDQGKKEIDNYIYAKAAYANSDDNDFNSEENSNQYEETCFYIFVDRISGQLLPFICDKRQIKNKQINRNFGSSISYYLDSEKTQPVYAYIVCGPDLESKKIELSHKEIIQLAINCRRKYKQSKTDNWPDLSSCRIVVNQNPIPVLVHFSLEIDKNFGDLVVSNETGDSYFQILSETLEKNSQFNPWISELKKTVVNITNKDKENEKDIVLANSDYHLIQIETAYKKIVENVACLDIEITDASLYNNYRNAVEQIMNSLYLIIEMIFKYYVGNISEKKINQIIGLSANLKKAIIKKIFKEYKIKHYFNDEIFRLLTLFDRNEVLDTIALCLTIESEEAYKPLKKLFSNHPTFLLDLMDIEAQRNAFSHASASEESFLKISSEKVKEYITLIHDSIQLLIPTFDFSKINNRETKLSLDQTDRIKASILLEKELPSLYLKYVKDLSTDLFNYYIDINVLYQRIEDKKNNDEYNLILQLNRFLEGTFTFVLSHTELINTSKVSGLKKYKRTGIEIIKKMCDNETVLNEVNEEINEEDKKNNENYQGISEAVFEWLKTVREKNIVNACNGEKSTLGGLFIALFLRISDNKLQQIIYSLNKNRINISKTVYELVSIRKHNESTYKPLGDLKRINQLKITVYFIVKSILENTNE